MVSTLAQPVDNANPPAIDDLRIDPEFESLHRTLTDDEYGALEANIRDDGCFTDPIIVWKGTRIVVDGRNRLTIWRSLPDDTPIKPPSVKELEFEGREHVTEWIILHQLGRRNLSSTEFDTNLARLHNLQKHGVGEAGRAATSEPKNGENPRMSQKHQSDALEKPAGKTAANIAAQTGVSQAKVERAVAWDKAVSRIAEVNPKAGADLRSGSLKVPKKDVITVSKLAENDDIVQAIKNWRNGRPWCDDGGPDKPPGAAIVLDALKRRVPMHLAEKHGTAASIQSVGSKLNSIKQAALALCDEPGGVFIDHDEVEQTFKRLKSLLTQARYWSECPRCQGEISETCDSCDGHGFLPFSRRGKLSQADKEWYGVL